MARPKKQAESEVLASFGIDGDFAFAEDLNIFGDGEQNAALLAVSVLMQGTLNEADFSERLANYAADIETDGKWDDVKTATQIADWASELSLVNGLAAIRNNIVGWNLSSGVPPFEKYVDIFWWQNYGLGSCVKKREGEVLQADNILSMNHGVHFICGDGAWRVASDIEKDTYKWMDSDKKNAAKDGDVKYGDVVKTNCYVFENKAWRTGNNSDCSLGLRGCTSLRQDTVGLGSDKLWYTCENNTWRKSTDIEKDTASWGEKFTEGDVRNGSVNTSFTYVFNGSNWRRGTILDSLMVKNGGLACAEKKNTTNGKIAVYKDTSSVKIGNLYYVCSSGTATLADTTYRWMVAPGVYNDTYELRGECANATDGDLMQGRVSNTKIYVCDFNDTDKDGEKGWESTSMVESVIGGCRSRQQDSVGLAKGVYYYCNEGTWRLASTLEYDTYHWNDTIDGAWKRGDVVNSNIYVFDEIEGGWRASTTAFDILSIDGCTVKRQLERANIYDEDNETNHYYTCYNKKWYDGNEWSWNLPKEAYLNPKVEYDTIIDAREGNYKTVKIGDQVWMAENLNYADSNQTPSLKGKSWCYDNNEKYCEVAGRLYTWAAAIDSAQIYAISGKKCGKGKNCDLIEPLQGICSKGWHLPSYNDWNDLISNISILADGNALNSVIGWLMSSEDVLVFSVIPSGFYQYSFGGVGRFGYFWSSSEIDSGVANTSDFNEATAEIEHDGKDAALSVRCVKDSE